MCSYNGAGFYAPLSEGDVKQIHENKIESFGTSLNEDRLAKLAQVLTPDELREHELQTSWTAINLRNQLAGIFHTLSLERRSVTGFGGLDC